MDFFDWNVHMYPLFSSWLTIFIVLRQWTQQEKGIELDRWRIRVPELYQALRFTALSLSIAEIRTGTGKRLFYVFDVKYKAFDTVYGVKREDLFQLHTYIGQYVILSQ